MNLRYDIWLLESDGHVPFQEESTKWSCKTHRPHQGGRAWLILQTQLWAGQGPISSRAGERDQAPRPPAAQPHALFTQLTSTGQAGGARPTGSCPAGTSPAWTPPLSHPRHPALGLSLGLLMKLVRMRVTPRMDRPVERGEEAK